MRNMDSLGYNTTTVRIRNDLKAVVDAQHINITRTLERALINIIAQMGHEDLKQSYEDTMYFTDVFSVRQYGIDPQKFIRLSRYDNRVTIEEYLKETINLGVNHPTESTIVANGSTILVSENDRDPVYIVSKRIDLLRKYIDITFDNHEKLKARMMEVLKLRLIADAKIKEIAEKEKEKEENVPKSGD